MSVSAVQVDRSANHRAGMVDIAEKVFLLTLFANFSYTMLLQPASGQLWALVVLLVISEALPVILLFIRRTTSSVTLSPRDWTLAFVGASFPLLAHPATTGNNIAPLSLCLVLIIGGLVLQLAAKVFLGRSFGVVAANRGVKSAGVYGLVRHPMYAGYVMTHIAIILAGPTVWNIAVYGLGFVAQLLRIHREEEILRQDPAYAEYANRVRYRLIPGVY
ncbi:MAG: isoprenylcysteine carboxylmethyltransferase family protein [Hyphomicrobiaceae bacterium]|nr:isoprenylcysteine carboxylmethyltransferase family protein [Hyphomicrobiaceae bacterium]